MSDAAPCNLTENVCLKSGGEKIRNVSGTLSVFEAADSNLPKEIRTKTIHKMEIAIYGFNVNQLDLNRNRAALKHIRHTGSLRFFHLLNLTHRNSMTFLKSSFPLRGRS